MKNIGDKILDFIKDYWHIVVAVICFIFIQKRSFVFINTDKKIKVELYDMCQDSLDNEEVLDGLNYEPKEIKYLAWHCAATKELMVILVVNQNVIVIIQTVLKTLIAYLILLVVNATVKNVVAVVKIMVIALRVVTVMDLLVFQILVMLLV